jgi:hypothetical protein
VICVGICNKSNDSLSVPQVWNVLYVLERPTLRHITAITGGGAADKLYDTVERVGFVTGYP